MYFIPRMLSLIFGGLNIYNKKWFTFTFMYLWKTFFDFHPSLIRTVVTVNFLPRKSSKPKFCEVQHYSKKMRLRSEKKKVIFFFLQYGHTQKTPLKHVGTKTNNFVAKLPIKEEKEKERKNILMVTKKVTQYYKISSIWKKTEKHLKFCTV